MTQLIQYASLRPTPWKNGGGTTTEIAAVATFLLGALVPQWQCG